ncbi:MAG: ATP-binding protein [Pirellulales bacterium]
MTKRDDRHEKLMRDLATLRLSRIAEIYREVLDQAARKNSSTLEVLSTLIAEEAIARSERALGRRIRQARLPKCKTLEESGSIVITTNRAFRDWGKIFDLDNTLATAMIDRLMHHGEAFVIRGDSYRMKDKDDQK